MTVILEITRLNCDLTKGLCVNYLSVEKVFKDLCRVTSCINERAAKSCGLISHV